MNFTEALIHEMLAISELENRVYPLDAPEAKAYNGVPYLIVVSSEGQRDKTLGGFLDSNSVSGELNVVATRYAQMKSIAAKAVDLLISLEGRAIGIDGPFIQEITYEPTVELYEERPKLYRALLEFEAYFNIGG